MPVENGQLFTGCGRMVNNLLPFEGSLLIEFSREDTELEWSDIQPHRPHQRKPVALRDDAFA
jgi:hypothetical protein